MKQWTETEEQFLINNYRQGETAQRIAYALCKSVKSVTTKACRLGLTNEKTPWPPGLSEYTFTQIRLGDSYKALKKDLIKKFSVDARTAASAIINARAKFKKNFKKS